MLFHSAPSPFNRDNWLFEPKLDGMRCVALILDGVVKLLSRHNVDHTHRYPDLTSELSRFGKSVILDGEIVAFGDNKKVSFERLEKRWLLNREGDIRIADQENPVNFFVFDVLHVNGHDMTGCTLKDRKGVLGEIFKPGELVRTVEYFEGQGESVYAACVEQGFEGVVAKDMRSRYFCGERSRSWLKIKEFERDDFLIGGFIEEQGFLVGKMTNGGRFVYHGVFAFGLKKEDMDQLRKQLVLIESSPFNWRPRAKVQWFQPTVSVRLKFMRRENNRALLRFPTFVSFTP